MHFVAALSLDLYCTLGVGERVENVILVHRSLDHDDLHPDLMQTPRIAHPLKMPDLELNAVTGWEFKSFPLERC